MLICDCLAYFISKNAFKIMLFIMLLGYGYVFMIPLFSYYFLQVEPNLYLPHLQVQSLWAVP